MEGWTPRVSVFYMAISGISCSFLKLNKKKQRRVNNAGECEVPWGGS
jgi:hypothetical protein